MAWIALIPATVLMQGAALAQGTASSATPDELQVAGRGGGIAMGVMPHPDTGAPSSSLRETRR